MNLDLDLRESSRGSSILSRPILYPTRSATWNLDRAKAPGIVDRRELLRGLNCKFLAARSIAPILLTVATQLFAYYVALERGASIDQPRNLAKSVTVE